VGQELRFLSEVGQELRFLTGLWPIPSCTCGAGWGARAGMAVSWTAVRIIDRMARWQVELNGHSFDLEELPRLLTDPKLRVVEEDGRYLLEAEPFEALTQAAEVHAAAKALLPRINGMAKLRQRTFHDVDVGPIREYDDQGKTAHHVVVEAATVQLRTKVDAVVVKAGEDEPTPPAPGSLESDKWMSAASSSVHLAKALALWGGTHDPTNLWKVWELLRDHSGIAIDPNLRRRFRPALNDRAVAGEEARHEVSSRQYPVEPDTMSISEAEAFLEDLLIQWLGSQS
jgi:hypothetical protein